MNSYEYLKLLTVLIETSSVIYDDTESYEKSSAATGFFINLNINGKKETFLITAKHFAFLSTHATLHLHYLTDKNTICSMPVTAKTEWSHLAGHDISFCSIEPFRQKLKKITGKEMYFTTINENNIMTEEDAKKINILSEVIMLGYPDGTGSTHHMFPLFKKGSLASAPCENYENNKGYVDISPISGYSGAPLLLNNSELKLVGVFVQSLGEKNNIPADMSIYVSADKLFAIKDKMSNQLI